MFNKGNVRHSRFEVKLSFIYIAHTFALQCVQCDFTSIVTTAIFFDIARRESRKIVL